MCEIFKDKVLHHWSVNVRLEDWKRKETVLKNTQLSLWCQKKSSNRWKLVCTIWCEPTVEPKLRDNLPSCSFYVMNTRQMWQISDFGRLHVNIYKLDMCNSNITRFESVKIGFCATRKFNFSAWLGKFFCCFVHKLTCNYNLAFKIRYRHSFAFWRTYLSSVGMFGAISKQPSNPSTRTSQHVETQPAA